MPLPAPVGPCGSLRYAWTWARGSTGVYSTLLDPIRANVRNVTELGVWGGASLRMWAAYFPQAEARCQALRRSTPRAPVTEHTHAPSLQCATVRPSHHT